MSLLRDVKGRRPPSNVDAVKLYENLSKLPLFRKKYDWNSNIWSDNQIKLLHTKVKQVLQRLALDSVVATYTDIDFDVKNSIANVIKLINTDHLYHFLVDDPFQFLDANPPVPPFNFEKINSVIFWNLVLESIGQEKKFSKISLDCHIKFLNSTDDGNLRIKLTPEKIEKLNNLIKTSGKFSWIDLAKKINCTPYQCYRFYTRNFTTSDSSNWSHELDKRLTDAVASNIGRCDWHAIAQKVGNNKTNEQCRLRWSRVLSKRDTEDPTASVNKKLSEQLKLLVSIYGKTNWTLIARHVNLTDKQCRCKYFASISGNTSDSDKMEQLIQAIVDFQWDIDKIKLKLELNSTFCKRKWVRLDPLGYYIYNTCTININNKTFDADLTNKLKNYVKELPHRETLLERIHLLKRRKLPIKKIYKSIDWIKISQGFKILHFVLGNAILKLEKIVVKNFKGTCNIISTNNPIQSIPDDWLDIIKDMLKQLWPIPSMSVIAIMNPSLSSLQ